jgi:hypothetical protein
VPGAAGRRAAPARVVTRISDPLGWIGPVRGHRVPLDIPSVLRGASVRA